MSKKLQEWLDEFIENGFSPDVSHWPEEGSVETNQPSVNITPSTSTQTILPDEGYVGFNQAVVAAVDNTIDNNIQAGNIKKNVTILGVTGNYEAPEVPTYTGPYTITENSTIAINGKQATQDISVEVPSASYTEDSVYFVNNGELVEQDVDEYHYYIYDRDGGMLEQGAGSDSLFWINDEGRHDVFSMNRDTTCIYDWNENNNEPVLTDIGSAVEAEKYYYADNGSGLRLKEVEWPETPDYGVVQYDNDLGTVIYDSTLGSGHLYYYNLDNEFVDAGGWYLPNLECCYWYNNHFDQIDPWDIPENVGDVQTVEINDKTYTITRTA